MRWGFHDRRPLLGEGGPVSLADGRVRLYYYASGHDMNSMGPHAVDAAGSADGVLFTREGTAFSYDGLVDPDVFWIPLAAGGYFMVYKRSPVGR